MSTREPFDPSARTSDTVNLGVPAAVRSHLASGTAVGRYVVQELIGEGGMGAVYKAFDGELNRAIALKVINTDAKRSSSRGGGKERLLREAQALARLSHPNVLPVYDVGTFGAEVFIATEFVAGCTLRAWLKAAPRTSAQIVATFLAAGQGLAAAHRAHLVHRDFKPENVMVGNDGRIRVLDFGLVRAARREQESARLGAPEPEPVATPLPPSAETTAATVQETMAATRQLSPSPRRSPPPKAETSSPSLASISSSSSISSPSSSDSSSPSLSTSASSSSSPPSSTSSSSLRSYETLDEMLLTPLTEMGSIMGTPRYMAPEQHRGHDVDARTDQFAFAVALYEALYGRLPFAAVSAAELKERVLAGDVIEPSRDSSVPRRLWPILERALAVSPDQRHPSMDALLTELGRVFAPASRRLWLSVALAALAIVAASATTLGWVAAKRRQRAICSGAELRLVGVWDPARKQQVRAAFLATKLPYAAAAFGQVESLFDRYAQGWTSMHTEACEAAQLRGEQSAELLDLRMECLGDRLSSFGAAVDVLAVADAKVVERADHAARVLPTLDDCADAAALRASVRPPADAETRARVADVHKQVGRARALEAAGRYADGLKVAAAAAAVATTLNYRPAEADALLALGTLQSSNGDPKSAVQTLREASLAADAGRADEVRAEALIILVEVAGEELSHYEDAHRFGDEAEIVLQRIEHRARLLATLERNLGILWWREGKYDVAIALLQKALVLRTAQLGPGDRSVAETLSDIADALADQGKLEEALVDYRRALDIWTASLGAEHPQLGVTINNMANTLSSQGKLDEALALFRRAQSIWERSLGPQHPRMGAVLNNIGDTYARLGRYKLALEYYERALPIFESAYGPAHYAVGVAYVSIGEAQRALGRLDAALASYRRGLAILEKALGPTHVQLAMSLADLGEVLRLQGDISGALAAYRRAQSLAEKSPDSPDLARVLVGLGQVHLARGAADEAVAVLQRAVALGEAHPGDPLALADARFTLARALWSQGRDRRRAGALASATRSAYEQAGPRGQQSLTTLDRWLERHQFIQ